MQGKSRWIGFLVIIFVSAGVLRTFAVPKEASSLDREHRSVEKKEALPDVVFQRSASDIIKLFPLPEGTKHFRYDVGQESGAVAGVATEKLIYQSDLGSVAAQVSPNLLIADDIIYAALPGCKLRRYNFNVIGKANPNGPGGDYTITYALYDNCPGAGGTEIPGTAGQHTFLEAEDDVVITWPVSVNDIPLPATPWLGLKTSRDNVGIIMGAPASVGFSEDILDFPGFACSANLGGFPNFGHATFAAELWGDLSCQSTHLAYHNVHDARGNFNPAGANNWMADDIELGLDNCNMVAYEVGVRDVGFYTFEILRDGGNVPGSTVSGTTRFFINSDPGTFKSELFKFTTPIPLGPSVFFAVRVGNDIGGAVLTGRDASWGRTGPQIWVLLNNQWIARDAPPRLHGGLYVSIQCAGEAQVGACCDMFLPDSLGDVNCRDIPLINCTYPPRGSSLRPDWNSETSCRICSHGTNTGLPCSDIEDCLGDFCVGGDDDGLSCNINEDCSGVGVCTIATCVDNDDAFLVRCGVSACCKPLGALGASCENLTNNECDAIEPVENLRQWERGQFCQSQGQRCPNPACLARQGECTADLPKRCIGGVLDGDICDLDKDCQGYCDLDNQTCDGGDRDGLVCEDNSNCPPFNVPNNIGVCKGFCLGGDPILLGTRCLTNLTCRVGQQDGICRFSGGDNTGVCDGGDRDGLQCFSDRNCKETTCECIPGCNQPLCCTDVCISLDPFCCEECWDETCSLQAARTESCAFPPTNDECAPIGRLAGARLMKINDRVDINVINATPAKRSASSSDPGYCCNTGPRPRCVGGGLKNKTLCDDNSDCSCDPRDDLCTEGNGFCPPGNPDFGAQALNTTWYRFDIPLSLCVGGGLRNNEACATSDDCICDIKSDPSCTSGNGLCPDFSGVQISTCSSNLPANDSLLQVFSIPTSDVGVCVDLGRCTDGTACNVASNNCNDGSNCFPSSEDCSVSAQDCPIDLDCTLDLTIACDNLSPIGCNDDAGDICNFDKRRNSFLCLSDLKRGQSYIIMMGIKEEESTGTYRLDISTTGSCSGSSSEPNDECINSMEIAEGQTPLDLNAATFSCPGETCLPNMRNDLWFTFTPDVKGIATIETCGPDAASTPDTEMVIYEGCVCPPPIFISCSAICDGECLLGSCSTVPMDANTCYMIRVADNNGGGGTGNLTLNYEPDDCNENGIDDTCDISCGDPGGVCDVPSCGRGADCNGNGVLDSCEIETVSCCPVGPLTYDPPAGVIDARYPYDPSDVNQIPAGIQTITVQGPAGALEGCWTFCETASSGVANSIVSVTENTAGNYTIELIRPITSGACSTLTYTDDAATADVATFIAHPSNVNAEGIADQQDVTEMIAILNGSAGLYGVYSEDIDRSGALGPADLLAVIDLLNGADLINGQGPVGPWMNTLLPRCASCTQ